MLINRAFMSGILFVFVSVFPASVAFARVPVETFTAIPDIGSPKISPDGKHIAAPIWNGKSDSVVVYDVDAPPGTKYRGVGIPKGVDAGWVDWANDDRILIGLTARSTLRYAGTT